ncbi:hypothetical protein GQ457_06G021600 [Hibiscus cannabinus]
MESATLLPNLGTCRNKTNQPRVQSVGNKLSRPWRWWRLFEEIDALSTQIPGVTFIFAPRERNQLADHLAKEGLTRKELFKAWW